MELTVVASSSIKLILNNQNFSLHSFRGRYFSAPPTSGWWSILISPSRCSIRIVWHADRTRKLLGCDEFPLESALTEPLMYRSVQEWWGNYVSSEMLVIDKSTILYRGFFKSIRNKKLHTTKTYSFILIFSVY